MVWSRAHRCISAPTCQYTMDPATDDPGVDALPSSIGLADPAEPSDVAPAQQETESGGDHPRTDAGPTAEPTEPEQVTESAEAEPSGPQEPAANADEASPGTGDIRGAADTLRDHPPVDSPYTSPNTPEQAAGPFLIPDAITSTDTLALDSDTDTKPKRGKRLTLQERLAQAAKAKKKAKEARELQNKLEDVATPPVEPAELLPAHTTRPEVALPQPAPSNVELELRQQIASLTQQVEQLQQRDALSEKAGLQQTIEQLLLEGQELLKKELKLNERVKTLVAANTRLETSLRGYAEKNEEALLRLGEIEDVMKTHRLKDVAQLPELLASAQTKVVEAEAALARERELNWEAKYRELQRVVERELEEKQKTARQLQEAEVQLQMEAHQRELEAQAKDAVIAQLNTEIMALKDENGLEVLRLEAKLENLRIENESLFKLRAVTLDTRVIDYDDYAKLLAAHHHLQTQYVSSQENWKIIELSMLSKSELLALTVETLKKGKAKTAAELKRLHARVAAQEDEIERLKGELDLARKDTADAKLQLQMKQTELAELHEKLDDTKAAFNADRQNYDLKIKAMAESLAQRDAVPDTPSLSARRSTVTSDRQHRVTGTLTGLGLQTNLPHGHGSQSSPTGMPPPLLSSLTYTSTDSGAHSSVTTPAIGQEPVMWEEAAYGDRNGLGQRQPSLHLMNHGSRRNFSEGLLLERYEHLDLLQASLTDEIYPQDASDMAEQLFTAAFGGGKNIQLITKMSLDVRRLEVELQALKEDNEQLAVQKETAQQEIVNLLAEQTRAHELEEQMKALQESAAATAKREETLLEVIGEKSERVAELQADVLDLKDLLRLQVQQMIEMADK